MDSTADTPRLTRGHKKKARTRSQLITAAVEVVAEQGEAFTAADVAGRAGVSNGTFYNYFEDRDELIAAIVPEVVSAFATESAELVDVDDPALRFATISALALARAAESPDIFRALLRLDMAQQTLVGGEPLRHLQADVAAGVAAGRFVGEADAAVLDVVVGALLLGVRRIVDGAIEARHEERLIARLLASLGVPTADQADLASQAVSAARELLRRN